MQGNSLTGVNVRMRLNSAAGRTKSIHTLLKKKQGQSADWDSFLLLGGQDNI